MTTLKVTPPDAGQRLDAWLTATLADLSRSRIQALIKSGHVTVDARAVKAHHKLVAGTAVRVTVPPPVPVELVPQDIALAILHDDADIVVINKPAGLVVHPAAGHASGTLVNALLYHCRDLAGIGGALRPGLVHRLDKDTSGVLVIAKHDRALANLVNQFKLRRVHKQYLALVAGTPTPPAGRIETLLGRSPHDRKKMSARPAAGRPAITHYRTLEVFPGAALLAVRIETGRTHQIRVHMKHIGHPVLGDRTYGAGRAAGKLPVPAPRQMLHAERLAFTHPTTGARVEFAAPLPDDMRQVLAALRAMA